MHVVVVRVGSQTVREHPRHIGAQLVHGRDDDVARKLVVELLDALA